MPYITREDGERFIIPSYRDILSAKKAGLLKKEIMLLSANYGEYITLQKKNATSFEIAFSPDPGYLLGECVWNYFKRPYDMIYCESIAGTNEAILVIVKSGSVYLDGSFPIDSIPEELIIFKTQQNNFSIFVSGDVPISEFPEEGKFSFDATSVRSFQVLDKPVFPTLPGVKAFQLQLVDTVLRSYGIGVLPVKSIVLSLVALGLGWLAYAFITSHPKEIAVVNVVTVQSNPYQQFETLLNTPDPGSEISALNSIITFLYTLPGWSADTIEYAPGIPSTAKAHVKSRGARLSILMDWAAKYNEKVDIDANGVYVTLYAYLPKRPVPTTINSLQAIIASMLDRMSYVVPGNSLSLGVTANRKVYMEAPLSINFNGMTSFTFDLIGKTIANMPLVLTGIKINLDNGFISGTINLKALGN